MGIENIMYFALGLLVAGLVALMVMPAIWRRAVRLTKKRIEAATPMTMAEFRADKDQLRAEFAVQTRKLEATIETLRRRLAEQLGDLSDKKADLSALRTDREQREALLAEFEEKETAFRARIIELERDLVDVTQRLRMRERDYETRIAELDELRRIVRGELPHGQDLDGNTLSGDYERDVDDLLTALALERKRAAFFEEQAQGLLVRLEGERDTGAAVSELRKALAEKVAREGAEQLLVAEARLAEAENSVRALLAEMDTAGPANDTEPRLLAEKLSIEEQTERVRAKVAALENDILNDNGTTESLREALVEIASDVSRLVFVADSTPAPEVEESLFERVQKFASDGLNVEQLASPALLERQPMPAVQRRGKVTDRMAALKEMQQR